VSDPNKSVFVNCPFDDDYKPSFEALLFTIASSDYQVNCALAENDAGDIRFDKLCRMISQSQRSVHDLSRVQLGDGGLPRFNMPFEFGLYLGAKRFGGRVHKSKTSLAMITDKYRLPEYLSDAGGSDPECHYGRPDEVIRVVRRYLAVRPDGGQLPGAARIISEFQRFKQSLPDLAASLHIAPTEIDPIRDYRDYVALLSEFLKRA
jgi:hypothetical protein